MQTARHPSEGAPARDARSKSVTIGASSGSLGAIDRPQKRSAEVARVRAHGRRVRGERVAALDEAEDATLGARVLEVHATDARHAARAASPASFASVMDASRGSLVDMTQSGLPSVRASATSRSACASSLCPDGASGASTSSVPST